MPYRRAAAGAAVRAALGVGLPLAAGVLADQRSLGVVAALGGFWAITQDGLDVHRSRLRRVLAVALAHTAGLTFGLLVLREAGRGWPVVAALAVAALVGGAVQGTTPARTAAGMHVVLGTVIGSGIDLPGPWWEPPAALLTGSLLVAATSAVPVLLRRRRHERLSLAHAYGWAAIGFAAGDDQGADGDRVKGQLVLALNQAQDVIGPARPDLDDLHDGLAEVVQLGELVTVARVRRTTVPREVRDSLLAVRTHLLAGRGRAPVAAARAENRERLRGVDSADPVTARVVAILTQDPDRTGASVVPRRRVQGLPVRERVRFAALLAVTVAVAGWLATLATGGGYWIPLTVAFVMRPDLGPVFVRALSRGAGTVAGVAVTAVAVLLVDDVRGLLVLVVVAAALLPTAQRRGYVWPVLVLVLTPIVFVFLDVLGEGDSLLVARVLDTVVGVALVLVADLLLRSQSPSSRTESQVRFAERAAELYAQRGPTAEPAERHALRRDAYRALTRARRSVELARREPLRSRRPSADLSARLDEIERAVDVATADVAVGPVG
ncbi:FUSC family protein [Solicola sp. PLA-1-18]|uniref:FUSC family protein n=1 Tax=Solicola sp. PLA-1-18 TaxID=3380532 RepID=UPI003B8107B6